jgi:hypothetical protein
MTTVDHVLMILTCPKLIIQDKPSSGTTTKKRKVSPPTTTAPLVHSMPLPPLPDGRGVAGRRQVTSSEDFNLNNNVAYEIVVPQNPQNS